MPSRKQRRRRQKSLRHDYEYVYVDDEGREVEVDPDEPKPERATKSARPAQARGRSGRKIQPPSWNRVGKRALIFAPFMFITLSLVGGKLSTAGRVLNTLILLAFFLPFSYLMDSVMYRNFLKRTGQSPPEAPPRRRRGSAD